MIDASVLKAGLFSKASLSTEYPTEETRDTLRELASTGALEPALTPLALAVGQDLPLVQDKYSWLFELPKERVPLHETEHGRMRGMSKGNDLADISGFYLAFGLQSDGSKEMVDHLAVQLEFYAHLLLRQRAQTLAGNDEGTDVVRDARRKFLHSHLGRFVDAVARATRVSQDAVYGPVLGWSAELVRQECHDLCVEPPPLEFFPETGERDDTNCGGVRLPVLDDRRSPQ